MTSLFSFTTSFIFDSVFWSPPTLIIFGLLFGVELLLPFELLCDDELPELAGLLCPVLAVEMIGLDDAVAIGSDIGLELFIVF